MALNCTVRILMLFVCFLSLLVCSGVDASELTGLIESSRLWNEKQITHDILSDDGIFARYDETEGETQVEPAEQEVPADSESEVPVDEPTTEEKASKDQPKSKKGYWQKVVEGSGYSFSFIFLSEIGDKTFLFVVLYATRMNWVKLFLISSIALVGMHIIGTAFGGAFQYIFSEFWLHWITVIAFFIFGVALLYMGITDSEEEEDFDSKMKEIENEMVEKNSDDANERVDEESLKKKLLDDNEHSSDRTYSKKDQGFCRRLFRTICYNESMRIMITIILTEMGDRSQISAVALAANYNFWIVAIAGSFGHMVAIVLAILFGKAVSHCTTERCMNIIGGILFLAFAAYSLVFN